MKNILFGFLITIALIVITIFFLIFFYLGCSYKKPTRKGGPYYFRFVSCKGLNKFYDEIPSNYINKEKYTYYEVYYNDIGKVTEIKIYYEHKIEGHQKIYYKSNGKIFKWLFRKADGTYFIDYYDNNGRHIETQYFDSNDKLIKIEHLDKKYRLIETQHFDQNGKLIEKK